MDVDNHLPTVIQEHLQVQVRAYAGQQTNTSRRDDGRHYHSDGSTSDDEPSRGRGHGNDSDDGDTTDHEYAALVDEDGYERLRMDDFGDSKNDGLQLMNLLYAIAEDQAGKGGITCNSCRTVPIRGLRYKCANCQDYDLCEGCEAAEVHIKSHVFMKIRIPIPPLNNSRTKKLPPFYPGIPQGNTATPEHLLQELLQKTHFDNVELDAMYSQYLSLSTLDQEGGGITRLTFEQALGPLGLEKNLITERIFRFFDQDDDGIINFKEMACGLSVLCKGNFDEKIDFAFQGYDLDGDGYISKEELHEMFKAYFYLSMELIRDVVKTMENDLIGNFEYQPGMPISSTFTAPIPREIGVRNNSGNNNTTTTNDNTGTNNTNGNNNRSAEERVRDRELASLPAEWPLSTTPSDENSSATTSTSPSIEGSSIETRAGNGSIAAESAIRMSERDLEASISERLPPGSYGLIGPDAFIDDTEDADDEEAGTSAATDGDTEKSHGNGSEALLSPVQTMEDMASEASEAEDSEIENNGWHANASALSDHTNLAWDRPHHRTGPSVSYLNSSPVTPSLAPALAIGFGIPQGVTASSSSATVPQHRDGSAASMSTDVNGRRSSIGTSYQPLTSSSSVPTGSYANASYFSSTFPVMESISQDAIQEMVDKTFSAIKHPSKPGFITLEEFRAYVLTDAANCNQGSSQDWLRKASILNSGLDHHLVECHNHPRRSLRLCVLDARGKDHKKMTDLRYHSHQNNQTMTITVTHAMKPMDIQIMVGTLALIQEDITGSSGLCRVNTPILSPSLCRQSDTHRTFPENQLPVQPLDRFKVKCALFQQPIEIGSFSYDEKRNFIMDDSQLKYIMKLISLSPLFFYQKYYFPPDLRKPNNLSVNYEKYISRDQTVDEHIDALLDALICIRDREEQQVYDAQTTSVEESKDSDKEKKDEIKPTSSTTQADFICYRGVLTKIMCTPYARNEPWELGATLYRGSIYIEEHVSQEKRENAAGSNDRHKLMSYWGYRFETICNISKPISELRTIKRKQRRHGRTDDGATTTAIPSGSSPRHSGATSKVEHKEGDTPKHQPENQEAVAPSSASTGDSAKDEDEDDYELVEEIDPEDPELTGRLDGIVDTNLQYCTVARTRIGQNSVIMGAEVDCISELKTSRVISNTREQNSFERHKLLKFWAQSFLPGIPTIIVGFRDDDGNVVKVETLKTMEIPRLVRGKEGAWDTTICINFLDAVFNFLRKMIVVDNPEVTYTIRWAYPFQAIQVEYMGKKNQFLTERFLKRWNCLT
ncbi:hypothetical protein BGZ54_009845 [Gamsiella multidivaricata]|nr:hypothetical protein BGZ54_009845 [Gamsiella multidivaricata]